MSVPFSLFRSAAILIVAATVVYALEYHLFGGIDWTPLRVPIELLEGSQRSGNFTANWDVVYEIRLDTERRLDPQAQSCLLGIEVVAPERCAGTTAQPILTWKVESSTAIVAKGVSEGAAVGYSGPTTGRILGAFEARRGQDYQVTITAGRSSEQLQETNPHLEVTVSPRARKWTYVWIGLLSIVAACCVLLGLVLSVMAVVRSRHEMK